VPLPESRAERGAHRLVDGLRRAAAPFGRWLRPLRRIPVELRVGIAVMVIFLGSFFAAVVPLLTTGGRDPRAEVSGRYPSTMRVGQAYALPVALDNTSGSVINPVCIIARSTPAGAVTPTDADFQGLETVPFVDGRACGGSLSGQEVINVRVTFAPVRAGTVRLTLVAAEGTREIGPALSGNVDVAAGQGG
jgi:hypothetical protein